MSSILKVGGDVGKAVVAGVSAAVKKKPLEIPTKLVFQHPRAQDDSYLVGKLGRSYGKGWHGTATNFREQAKLPDFTVTTTGGRTGKGLFFLGTQQAAAEYTRVAPYLTEFAFQVADVRVDSGGAGFSHLYVEENRDVILTQVLALDIEKYQEAHAKRTRYTLAERVELFRKAYQEQRSKAAI